MLKFERKIFSETLAILRERKGLTQLQLAKSVGLGRNSITTYEIGRSVPPLDTLIDMCNVLDCDLNTMIYGLQHSGHTATEKEMRLKHANDMLDICEKEKVLLKEFLNTLDRKNEELAEQLEKSTMELKKYKSKK